MRCDQCGQSVRGESVRTATRVLCARCGERFLGAAAGLTAGGGVPEAVSTAGWLERIRRLRRRDSR